MVISTKEISSKEKKMALVNIPGQISLHMMVILKQVKLKAKVRYLIN